MMRGTRSPHGIIAWRRTIASQLARACECRPLLIQVRWPVIVGIIVGSLILISVVTCIARCICCGAECACCCFRCCACCCPGSGRSGHKRVKSDPTPTYPTPYGAPPMNPYSQAHSAAPPPPIDTRPVNQQYRSNAMPAYGLAPTPKPERPQFATFDSTRAVVNDDALPAMPTWKDGRDVHVAVEEQPIPEKRGDMEMDRLNRNGSGTSSSMAAMAVPGARRSPGPGLSPVSPVGDNYGFPLGYQNAPPHHNSPGPYGSPQDDYRRGSPGANSSLLASGAYGATQNQPYGRRSPGQTQPQAYDSYGQPEQQPYSQAQYAQRDPYDQRDYQDEHVDRYQSPAPPPANHPPYHDPYEAPAPAPQRSYTPLSGSTRYEPSTNIPASAYPGQQPYNASAASAYPGQTAYQAFQPGAGVPRKAVDGSYREL
jgi:hypothetical protein